MSVPEAGSAVCSCLVWSAGRQSAAVTAAAEAGSCSAVGRTAAGLAVADTPLNAGILPENTT